MRFVVSKSQFLGFYQREPQHIITRVLNDYLAHPIKYALYVGCSFTDQTMNEVLRQAAERLPGREHYALLKWPGPSPYPRATAAEIDAVAAKNLAFGVRPIWFELFGEIPAMIDALE